MFEQIVHEDEIIAVIISSDEKRSGIHFFTPFHFSQQLAYMNRPKGYIIEPHVHNELRREVFYTQEVLFVRKGKIKVDLYNRDRKYLESRVLQTGDVILLATGGHGFEMLEETEMIEVKQGPYSGDQDKVRFDVKD
jgi:mannose-6-phosphate isomerase-like protein (cupin superfamily)